MTVLLLSWLLAQDWAWDVAERAVSYRVYWTERADVWCGENFFVPVSDCNAIDCHADWPEPASTTFYSVVAVDSTGQESVWDRAVPKTECFP